MSAAVRPARARVARRALRLAPVLLALVLAGCGLECPGSEQPIRRAIRADLAQLPLPHRRRLRIEAGEISPLVERFYQERRDRPAWVTRRGAGESAQRLLEALDDAGSRGLDRHDYPARRIRLLLARTDVAMHGPRPAPEDLARLDVACTSAFLLLATHLAEGRVHPRAFDPDWHYVPRTRDVLAALRSAVESANMNVPLDDLEPLRPAYADLRRALMRYQARAAAGGWAFVPPGGRLAPGMRGARVAALRARLAAENDLDSTLARGDGFDARVREAVRRFQRRFGLDTTGMVGPADLEALNVPAADRAHTIALNLERMRWMSDTLSNRYAWVNIPEYLLHVIEDGQPAFTSRVVVGSDSTRTPVFRAALKLMVLNPYWRIPPRIASSEMLDEIKRDPSYLSRNSIRVMQGTGPTAREVDPTKVNWSAIQRQTFAYRLLQDPGPENAVGHVKFMCPNPWSVYLHDTPATWLFRKADRAFSHGCVRVEQPLALALVLLRGKPGWDSLRVATAFDTCYNDVVFLPEPLPVHIVYFTAWTDTGGAVQFRRDVYGLDAALTDALHGVKPPPRRASVVLPGAGPAPPPPRAVPAGWRGAEVPPARPGISGGAAAATRSRASGRR